MLQEVIDAWQAASQQQTVLEQDAVPGKVTFQKSVINFDGAEFELTIAAVDPSVGIDVDRPETFTKRLTALNTHRNVKLPARGTSPAYEIYSSILQAKDPDGDEEKYINKRNKNFRNSLNQTMTSRWKESLEKLEAFTEDDINRFLTKINSDAKNDGYFSRIGALVETLVKYSVDLTSKAPCGHSNTYTIQLAIYDSICRWIDSKYKFKNPYGDDTFSIKYVNDVLVDTTRDNTLPEHMLSIKNILRGIYAICQNKPARFCYVLNSLADYYEKATGESVTYRLANIHERDAKRKEYKKRTKELRANNKTKETRPATNTPKTEKEDKRPEPSSSKKEKAKTTREPINFVPMGNDMFERALAEAKPLKNK